MADFTHEIPDEKKFYSAVRQILSNSSSEIDRVISEKLTGGNCSIVASGQFSGDRWNAYSTGIYFYIPIENVNFFEKEHEVTLLRVCDRVMPKIAGYDIQYVEISPILDSITVDLTLSSDLEEITNNGSLESLLHLPNDIKQRGKEMSEAYIYLYCVENSLRLFIDKVFSKEFGENYLSSIIIPNYAKKSIQVRKELETKNQWISIRDKQELFYLDFKDLVNIITANWEVFKQYFPDQQWLIVKIDELGNCRNLIAHNSLISDMERNIIRLNYNQILKQIQRDENKNVERESSTEEIDELPF